MENIYNQSGSSERSHSRNRSRNRNRNRGGQNQNRNLSANKSGKFTTPSGKGGENEGNRRNRPKNKGRNREQKAVKLTFFQKLLRFFGLGGGENKRKVVKKIDPPQGTSAASEADVSNAAPKPSPNKEINSGRVREVTSPRLYIGNLDYEASESELEELFRGVGKVISAEVVTNARTQQSKGFAFVEMASIEEARRAVEVLHNEDFMGRPLTVSGAKSEGPRQSEED